MVDREECQKQVSELLDAIITIAHVQRTIDDKLVSDFKMVPNECKPALLLETEPSSPGECPIEAEITRKNMEHRQYAKQELLKLADELEEYGHPYLAVNIKESAREIDVTDKLPLATLAGINEMIAGAIEQVFINFTECMVTIGKQ